MNIFKFRQIKLNRYMEIYLFQSGRWELGFTLDINGRIDCKPEWSTWLFSINFIFIYLEIHGKQDD
jgi:hypothetical protein